MLEVITATWLSGAFDLMFQVAGYTLIYGMPIYFIFVRPTRKGNKTRREAKRRERLANDEQDPL